MRISEASKFLGIPASLILEIIDDHELDVERYINGNHDLTFDNMVLISNIHKGVDIKPKDMTQERLRYSKHEKDYLILVDKKHLLTEEIKIKEDEIKAKSDEIESIDTKILEKQQELFILEEKIKAHSRAKAIKEATIRKEVATKKTTKEWYPRKQRRSEAIV